MSTEPAVLVGGPRDGEVRDFPARLVRPLAQLYVQLPFDHSAGMFRPSIDPGVLRRAPAAVYELVLDWGMPSRDDLGRPRFTFRGMR